MEKYNGLEIAVIGLAGRFPKADTIAAFWNNLKTGLDCISDFTEQELLDEGIPAELLQDPLYVRSNAFSERKQYFDSAFFNYRPDEAALMDPQMRMFHECCWEALEDSGYSTTTGTEKIGLFATGSPGLNWLLYANYINKDGDVDAFTAGNLQEISFLCSRISYKLNLNGPSVFSQSACSSSLVTIHQACNSLLLGECNMALAGGVTLNNFSRKGYLFKEGLIYSRDGRCHAFDSSASGTVQGEGAGVVVLKRLSEAIRDRDNIYAVIKGSAINNDGNDKVGYTAPSVKGQAEVIRRAFKMAGIKPKTVTYVEAHGTGTELGDPVEIEALNSVFATADHEKNSCAIGSVKSNMGHLDSAAGVAGFIKAVLSLKHRHIPASLHFTSPNPKIDFAGGPFYVNAQLKEWTASSDPLRAGVSSFGIGGTNAHAILEEAPPVLSSDNTRDYQLLTLSAKSGDSLERMKASLLQYLEENKAIKLADIAYTLQKGRVRFNHRAMLAGNTHEEAINALKRGLVHTHTGADNQEALQHIVFMFSGQGSQYVNMCADLYKNERLFKEKVDECIAIASEYSDIEFLSVLYPGDDITKATAMLLDTSCTQPALFIIEYALAQLLLSWGIRPHYMVGHSIGEYTAACISGVFSLRDTMRLVIKRGQLMSSAEAGSMLSLSMTKEQLMPLLDGVTDIELAVVNSPNSLVVAGKTESIAAFEKKAIDLGYAARPVHTSHAFHSWMMDMVLEKFEQEVAAVTISAPAIPYISNVTGEMADYEIIRQPAYWSKHLRSCVEFSKGMDTLLNKGAAVLIEVGPGKTLCNYAAENSSMTDKHIAINMVRQAKQTGNDSKYLTEKLGHLWLNGVTINWDNYYAEEKRKRVSLPTYSFEKTPYRADVDAIALISREISGQSTGQLYKAQDSIHSMDWQQSASPNVAEELNNSINDFIIFDNSPEFNNQLADVLVGKGQRVTRIYTGNDKPEQYDYSVNLIADSAIKNLLEDLTAKGIKTEYIIYASALTMAVDQPGNRIYAPALEAGYLGLGYLCKAIAGKNETGKTTILVVNNYLATVLPDDEIDPVKSTILGPARLIGIENENIQCKTVDIPYPFSNGAEAGVYVQYIIDELFYDFNENFVAWRHKQRWIPGYRQLQEQRRLTSGVSIKKDATYIVVGGMGGMGLTVASDIARNYGAEVIIVHRSPFPGRSQWAGWIAEKDAKDDTVKRILKLQELERDGARIVLQQVNVAVEQEVQQFITTLHHNNKHINGLIWAAGEVDYGGIILNRNQEGLINYISSKVHGLLFFEKYMNFRELDFLALFSSMGNVFYHVKFGQVAYNAANEFLTGYATYARKQLNIHAFSINWCDWMDVGMTVRSLMQQKNITDVRQVNKEINMGLTPAEGVTLFHTCLSTRLPAYFICKGNITEQIKHYKSNVDKARQSNETGKTADEKAVTLQHTPSELLKLYADFFGKPNITLHDDFFELGGDSLKAMTLVSRINKKMGFHLTIADIYKHTTISEMAAALELIKETPTTTTKSLPASQLMVDGKLYYELGEPQSYWINDSLEKEYKENDKNHGLLVLNYRISGDIDLHTLRKAIEYIIQRHECLRSTFHWMNGKAMTRVEDSYNLDDIFDYWDTGIEGNQFRSHEEFIHRVYLVDDEMVLCRDLPIRLRLTKMGDCDFVLTLKIHHIASDAWSNNLLLRDLLVAYRAFAAGEQPKLPELKYQFKDIMAIDVENERQNGKSDIQFWESQFRHIYKAVPLPAPKRKNPDALFKVRKNTTFRMPAKIAAALKSISQKQGMSFFIALQTSFKYYLFHKTGQADQGLGTFYHGRKLEADNLLGNYAKLVFIRTLLDKNDSFIQAMEKVNKANEDMRSHQAYTLVNYLKGKYPEGQSIYDSFMKCSVQYASDNNFFMDNSNFKSDWKVTMMRNFGEYTMLFDMDLTFYETFDHKLLMFTAYDSTGFYLKDIREFIAGYFSFLKKITAAPRTGLQDLEFDNAVSLNLTVTQ